MDNHLSNTDIGNFLNRVTAKDIALHSLIELLSECRGLHDIYRYYYLTLLSSATEKNFLELQMTDLETGKRLAYELEHFLGSAAEKPNIPFDLAETVRRYDRVLKWVSHHVSRAFNESSLRNTSSSDACEIFPETYDVFFEEINRMTLVSEEMKIERQLLLDTCSIHVQAMNATVEQRHIDLKLTCSICLANFILDETVCNTPCNHLFHPQCITTWFQKKKTCPLCRTNCHLITSN